MVEGARGSVGEGGRGSLLPLSVSCSVQSFRSACYSHLSRINRRSREAVWNQPGDFKATVIAGMLILRQEEVATDEHIGVRGRGVGGWTESVCLFGRSVGLSACLYIYLCV